MAGEGGSQAERYAGQIELPLAGTVLVQAVTTAAVIDLAASGSPGAGQGIADEGVLPPTSSIGQPTGILQGQSAVMNPLIPSGFVGHWVDIEVDSGGGDLGYVAGPTNASVSGGNAPVIATTGVAGTAGTCRRITAGTGKPFFVTPNRRFLGVVSSSGTCTVRISLSSR